MEKILKGIMIMIIIMMIMIMIMIMIVIVINVIVFNWIREHHRDWASSPFSYPE